MKIKLFGLTEGEHVVDEDVLPESLGIDREEITRPIHASIRIDKRGGNYYIKIFTATEGSFLCDRCLEPFERELTGEVMLVYTENEELFAEGEEEDLRLVSKSGDEIDLSSDERDAVLLTIPIKRLCREECKGLCPACGANRNNTSCACTAARPDPRWDALRKLKF